MNKNLAGKLLYFYLSNLEQEMDSNNIDEYDTQRRNEWLEYHWKNISADTVYLYEDAAEKLFSKLFQELDECVVYFREGRPRKIMTGGELRVTVHLLTQESGFVCAEPVEAIPRLAAEAVGVLGSRYTDALTEFKAFKEDVLCYLRAIALVASSVGNAGSHQEKDARLRGLVSQIETAIQAVHTGYESQLVPRMEKRPDLFRSDYPVLEYRRKIRDLEMKLKSYEQQEKEKTEADNTD